MFERLTILAPGLLGASIAKAARARGLATHIAIWTRRGETRRELKNQTWCDSIHATVSEAVAGANLVVIAAPVDCIVALAKEASPALSSDAVVTDVGSVKAAICASASIELSGHSFIGSHPMAGSEKTGWQYASESLFADRTCFITPLPRAIPTARKCVVEFWTRLGCKVVQTTPEKHDKIVAHISHLPQVLASALCSSLAKNAKGWGDLAGGGLKDTTRIAGSDPLLWKTILENNRDEVLIAINEFRGELSALEKALRKKQYRDVVKILARGQKFRRGF